MLSTWPVSNPALPTTTLGSRCCHHTFFTDEETEGWVTLPQFPAELGLNSAPESRLASTIPGFLYSNAQSPLEDGSQINSWGKVREGKRGPHRVRGEMTRVGDTRQEQTVAHDRKRKQKSSRKPTSATLAKNLLYLHGRKLSFFKIYFS